jgi:hypothetical protein
MSNPGGLSGGFIGGGGGSGGGTSFAGVGNGGQLIDRRIDYVSQAINTLSRRITDLEEARDEKVEPYDVMDSFRATKKDAGEPANQYFVDCLKENAKLVEENDVLRYQYETMKNETARCKGLFDQLAIENQRLEKIIADKQKVLDGEKAAAINIEESSTYWQQRYNEQLQTTDILYKELDFYRKIAHDLELEKNDAKWYKEQAIKKCIDIVEKNKNDPLTRGECKRWMVAICEDIQQEIKKEFGVK